MATKFGEKLAITQSV